MTTNVEHRQPALQNFDFDQDYRNQAVANAMLGKFLGQGAHRMVYAHPFDRTKVIKVARNAHGVLANANEFQTWEWYCGCIVDAEKEPFHPKLWLCPVDTCSADGMVLVCTRADEVSAEDVPEHIPKWATDDKVSNFGMLDGRLVQIDFGFHLLLSYGNGISFKKGKRTPKDWAEYFQ